MNVVRHRLTRLEQDAIDAIVGEVRGLEADRPIERASQAGAPLESVRRSPREMGWSLDLRAWPDALRALQALPGALASCAPENGGRVVILENVATEPNAPATLLLVGSLLGHVVEYAGHGAAIVEISNHMQGGSRPSSDNDLQFELHTDMSFYAAPPAIVSFFMLNPGDTGGESLFCDAGPIVERLPADVLAALRRPFRFPAPPHDPGLGEQQFAILGPEGARVRFRRDGLEAIDAHQLDALRVWEAEIDANAVELTLRAGDIAIFSNTRTLHGRRAFSDATGSGRKRRALRAYIEPGTPPGPPLA